MSDEKYVIRHKGEIQGGYTGKSKEDALNNYAKDKGHDSFEKMVSAPDKSAGDFHAVHESDAHK